MNTTTENQKNVSGSQKLYANLDNYSLSRAIRLKDDLDSRKYENDVHRINFCAMSISYQDAIQTFGPTDVGLKDLKTLVDKNADRLNMFVGRVDPNYSINDENDFYDKSKVFFIHRIFISDFVNLLDINETIKDEYVRDLNLAEIVTRYALESYYAVQMETVDNKDPYDDATAVMSELILENFAFSVDELQEMLYNIMKFREEMLDGPINRQQCEDYIATYNVIKWIANQIRYSVSMVSLSAITTLTISKIMVNSMLCTRDQSYHEFKLNEYLKVLQSAYDSILNRDSQQNLYIAPRVASEDLYNALYDILLEQVKSETNITYEEWLEIEPRG